MSTYEVLTLLILFGTFLVALLAYIDRNNKRKQINLPCTWRVEAGLFYKQISEANHFIPKGHDMGSCSSSVIYISESVNQHFYEV